MGTSLKEQLRSGKAVSVCDPDFPTPKLVEFIGTIGFDAVFIDCEHSSTDFRLVEELARAARASGMDSVLRPYSNEEGLLNRYLSCGAGGLQVPHVHDAAEANRILDGLRRWGDGNFEEKLFLVMIESAEALKNLPALLKIRGIDAFYIGTNDLAESMGHRGNPQHPAVEAAVTDTIKRIVDAGGAVGMNVQNDLDAAPELLRLGVRWITVHARNFVKRGAVAFLQSVGQTSPRRA